MPSRSHWCIVLTFFILILVINVFLHWRCLSSFSEKQRFFKTLVLSGIALNSFNPPILRLTLNTQISPSQFISIIDNNIVVFQLSNSSTTKMMLSDGFHHLDIIIFDEIENVEFYQTMDISTGTQSIDVTVLDEHYKPVENVSVHLELVDYSHISVEHQTNRLGEVIFHHLPRNEQVYIEAICMNTKRHAYIGIHTCDYRNITLILKQMSALYDDEYNPTDRGYYAV